MGVSSSYLNTDVVLLDSGWLLLRALLGRGIVVIFLCIVLAVQQVFGLELTQVLRKR